jgi:outer membrane protein assembly factor BamD (BamD/ComL family)
LAEQNRLLAAAMDASRASDDRRAIALLGDLLARYPSSPLAQEAEVQRFRALARSGDRREAARRARQYLAAYPNGFAREEAKTVALEP